MQNNLKQCKNCGKDFQIAEEDQKFYEKIKVPEPQMCPFCREQRRISFRNERNLYLRECGGCKKQIVSIYSSDKKYNVYCAKCFWSDKWDPVDVGRDFDFNRPFFEQFDELLHVSKVMALFGTNNQNADFVNQETDDKNCYMNAGGHFNEDCYYNTYSIWGKNNVDNYWIIKSELCYECINCEHCFQSTYLQDCQNCLDCHFCRECIGCNNCFGCFGLRHKEFYFFNEKLSKENYKEKIKNYQSRKQAYVEAKKHFLKYPHRAAKIINCEDCTGDYLIGCKDVKEGYLIDNSRDCKYIYIGLEIKDSMDISSIGWGEVLYNCASSITLNHVIAVSSTINLNFSQYCFCCSNSSDLFGSVGLNHKQYCIFNKQYSKEEYFSLRDKIIEYMKKTKEYGEFFPAQISPFCYNETIAYEYFPLTKEEVLKKGWKWKDADKKEYKSQTYKISDKIEETQESITAEILACASCNKNYKIILPEYKFYKRINIPIPHNCPQCRHKNRLAQRNPHRLWTRDCQKCGSKIQTTYSLNRPEIVYCEKCYLNETYS